ncbi:MAG TPA: DNA-processing protein DprA [Candidatus Paceibacterota bacterium]|nr:DNA-processing protein DprA [Candidatus Paceibacterota bacterium]
MNSIRTIEKDKFPSLLREACSRWNGAPRKLYLRGTLPPDDRIFLTIVGSRKWSAYGKSACESLIRSLSGLPVVIISGLALGIDSIAHEAALAHGIPTIAVPGSGLADDMIYPASHAGLARRIVESGGALLSPFEETIMGNDWTFPYRNRIMAGMAHATLVIEAGLKSGTLITARNAIEFDRNLLVVPGSIFSEGSSGPHQFLKLGATPITSGDDLVEALGFGDRPKSVRDYSGLPPEERKIMEALQTPLSRDGIIQTTGMSVPKMNALISLLEIKGLIKESNGLFMRL